MAVWLVEIRNAEDKKEDNVVLIDFGKVSPEVSTRIDKHLHQEEIAGFVTELDEEESKIVEEGILEGEVPLPTMVEQRLIIWTYAR